MPGPEAPPPTPNPEDDSVEPGNFEVDPQSEEDSQESPTEVNRESEERVADGAGELAAEETVRVEKVDESGGESPASDEDISVEDSTGSKPINAVIRQGLQNVRVTGLYKPVTKEDKKKYSSGKYYTVEGVKAPVAESLLVLESSPAYKYFSQGILIERPPEGKIGRGGRRHFGGYKEDGDGTYDFVYDLDRISERINVPKEVLEAAAKKGVSPEYLVRAKENDHAGEYLRSLGIEWGKEKPPYKPLAGREVAPEELKSLVEDTGIEITADYINFARAEAERGNIRPADYLASLGLDLELGRLNPPDPVIKVAEIGRRRRKNIGEIIKQIEKDPEEVRKSLSRPGKLPLWLHKTPVVGPAIAKRITALRIVRKTKKEMPLEIDNMHRRLEELRNLGVRNEIDQEEMETLPSLITEKEEELERSGLRWALNKYQRYHNYLDNLDESVKSHRKRLIRTDRSKLFGEAGATQRRNLAYRIFDTRLSLRSLDDLIIIDMNDPEFVHNHEIFKKMRKELRKSMSRAETDIN